MADKWELFPECAALGQLGNGLETWLLLPASSQSGGIRRSPSAGAATQGVGAGEAFGARYARAFDATCGDLGRRRINTCIRCGIRLGEGVEMNGLRTTGRT